MAVRTRQSWRLDMSSLDIAASPPIHRDETVQISLLLAFTGGYLDAYTFAALCVAFGVGAAVGAYGTKIIPGLRAWSARGGTADRPASLRDTTQ
jgi:hypothetical protein